jgi:hypothetical protein
MNKRKMTLLSVAAAALMAGALMGSVWFAYFSGGNTSFQLPALPPPGEFHLFEKIPFSDSSLTPVTVDAENVQTLLKSVERVSAYSRTVECVTYWPGGKGTVIHNMAHRDGITRLETIRSAQSAQNQMVTPDVIYVWTGSAPVVHEVSPKNTDAEALAGIPAWEDDILALPAESILYAEYFHLNGERVLRIEAIGTIYHSEYVVSLETGLLVKAVFTDADGELAYEVNAKGPPITGDPGDDWFTLPDGRVVFP